MHCWNDQRRNKPCNAWSIREKEEHPRIHESFPQRNTYSRHYRRERAGLNSPQNLAKIRRYIEPSRSVTRFQSRCRLWGRRKKRKRRKNLQRAQHGGRLHRGGHIPGWELLHATFRLYCDLCARWGWLRATIYGFRDEGEGWSNVGCRMARDRLQRDYKGSSSPRRSIPSSPSPILFKRVPHSFLRFDSRGGRVRWTRLITDKSHFWCLIRIRRYVLSLSMCFVESKIRKML